MRPFFYPKYLYYNYMIQLCNMVKKGLTKIYYTNAPQRSLKKLDKIHYRTRNQAHPRRCLAIWVVIFLLGPSFASSSATIRLADSSNTLVSLPIQDEWQVGSGLIASSRPWQGVIVHHTATSSQYSLKDCHKDHKARGWDSCGYNFLIAADGSIVSSRGFGAIGAHTRGHNSTHLGVALITHTHPTIEQVEVLEGFIRLIRAKFGDIQVSTHREHTATKCPGDVISEFVT